MSIVIYCTVIKSVFQKHVMCCFPSDEQIYKYIMKTHTHTHRLVSQTDCLAQRVSLIHLMTSPLQVFVKGKSFEGDGVTLGTKAGVKTQMTLLPQWMSLYYRSAEPY